MTYLQKLKGAYVITDLAVWQFEKDEKAVSHISEQIAKAIIISYNMGNFGPDSFSFVRTNGEEEDGE